MFRQRLLYLKPAYPNPSPVYECNALTSTASVFSGGHPAHPAWTAADLPPAEDASSEHPQNERAGQPQVQHVRLHGQLAHRVTKARGLALRRTSFHLHGL